MWHPLRGVLEPFSEHRLLLARGHGSPYHQRAQNGYSAASEGAPRWRGSGRLQKRSVEHASHRRGPTSDSAILSELARCYCLHTARAQAACQGVDRQLTKPLACTAQWRKSANRMVKGRSPERRATATLRRFPPFAGLHGTTGVDPMPSLATSRAGSRATRKRSFGSDFWSYWRTGSCQFVEQRLCLFQIDGVEALGEPAVDRRQQIDGHVALVSLGQHSRQRRGGAQCQ
jgi:hypothetical protein